MGQDSSKSLSTRLLRVAGKKKLALALSYSAIAIGMLATVVPFLAVYKISEQFLIIKDGNDQAVITLWVLIAGISIAVNMVFSYLGNYGSHRAAFYILYDYRIKIMEQLGIVPLGYFADNSSGSIQRTMDDNIEKIEGFVAHMLPDLIGSLAVLLVLFGSLVSLSPWLALAVLLTCLVAMVIQFIAFGGRKGRALWASLAKSQHKMTSAFSENVNGMAEVKLFGLAGSIIKTLEESINKTAFWEEQQFKKAALPMGFYKALVMSILSILMPIGLVLIILNPGNPQVILTFLMALILAPAMYNPFVLCLSYGSQLGILSTSLEAVEKISNHSVMTSPASPQTPSAFDMSFNDVSFSYQSPDDPSRIMALDGLSFTAEECQMTALVGASGSGKSTVAQLLARFWDRESGSIQIGGVDIKSIDPSHLMDIISIVLQDTYIFSDTVYDNITMGGSYSQEEVERAARAAQCHGFISKLPKGYQTHLGAGGVRLSGGEAQRLAIARVILKDAPLIVLDEALAYSDAENENLIQEAIKEMVKSKTVLVIAHRLQSIQAASHIYVFLKGRVVEDGTHEELMQMQGEYSELWHLQNVADTWELLSEEVPA